MQTLNDYIDLFFKTNAKQLQHDYPGLTCQRLKKEIEWFCMGRHESIDEMFSAPYILTNHNPISNFFAKVLQGIPLAYVTKSVTFYNSEYFVDSSVLIPRPETERLVELTLEYIATLLPHKRVLDIVDVGTGAGVIAITLLQELAAIVNCHAVDISPSALAVAKRNYYNLRYTIPCDSHIDFFEGDRLDVISGNVDLIVSNPPYIMEHADRDEVHHQVVKFEPSMALFLNDDSYDNWFFYFFKKAMEVLRSNGFFIMEGHEKHLKRLKQIAESVGARDAVVLHDYAKRDRFLFFKK